MLPKGRRDLLGGDAQVTVTPEGAYSVGPEIALRLDDAVNVLVNEALRPVLGTATQFLTVPFAQVRCSV